MAIPAASLRLTMLTTLIWTLLHFSQATTALPSTPKLDARTCTNHLLNPSFESGAVDPWLPIVESAWSVRGVFANPFTHSGTHHYYAHATSTVESSFTLSQSGINAPVGRWVDCYAWVAGKRSGGVTNVEVFLDGVSCGTRQLGVGDAGWKSVGSRLKTNDTGNGVGSTIAIVATSKSAGDDGWEIWVDDVGVVSC